MLFTKPVKEKVGKMNELTKVDGGNISKTQIALMYIIFTTVSLNKDPQDIHLDGNEMITCVL